MTEYRAVATLDTESVWSGEKHHYDVAGCITIGRRGRYRTYDKDEAERFLRLAKEECPKFDKMTQARNGRNDIHYWQTNIRIQTREVTEWV